MNPLQARPSVKIPEDSLCLQALVCLTTGLGPPISHFESNLWVQIREENDKSIAIQKIRVLNKYKISQFLGLLLKAALSVSSVSLRVFRLGYAFAIIWLLLAGFSAYQFYQNRQAIRILEQGGEVSAVRWNVG